MIFLPTLKKWDEKNIGAKEFALGVVSKDQRPPCLLFNYVKDFSDAFGETTLLDTFHRDKSC